MKKMIMLILLIGIILLSGCEDAYSSCTLDCRKLDFNCVREGYIVTYAADHICSIEEEKFCAEKCSP